MCARTRASVFQKLFSAENLTSIISVLLAFGVGALAMLLIGANPLIGYSSMLTGAFGSIARINETLTKTAPILLMALCFLIPAKTNTFNIGGEGQLYLGAIVVTVIALTFPTLPSILLMPLLLLSSFLAGAAWAFIPGILKIKIKVNEIITSVLTNYIPILLTDYLVMQALRTGIIPQSEMIPPSARLPSIPGTSIHFGLLIGIVLACAIYVILKKTVFGYEITAVGENAKAATYAGIRANKMILISMCIGGGLGGLAGLGEISGVQWRLRNQISPGYGFYGIAAALLGKNNPLGAVVSSILFSALITGAESMQRGAGVPISFAYLIQGVLMICVLGGEVITRKMGLE